MNAIGSKSGCGVYQSIINRMPPHRVYIEPCWGGGSVARKKRPAEVTIGIDLDPALIDLARSADWNDTLGELTQPSGRAGSSPAALTAALSAYGDGRPRCAFAVGDGIEFMEVYPFVGDELVYLDPPYMMRTRTSGRRRFGEHEMTDAQHVQLLKAIVRCPARVMISGYYTDLYAKRLAKWTHHTFTGQTHGGPREEWLWYNFPRPTVLHDYRYLGDRWPERHRLKKLHKRWLARLQRMPVLERQALLSAIGNL